MKFFFFSILLLLNVSIYSQDQLSLNEAIKIALQKNSGLLTNQNNMLKSESALTAAYGNFLPNLGASGNWNWNKNKGDGYEVDSRSWSIGINSSIVLFDGLSNFANLSQSQNNYEAVKLSIEQKKQEVIFQTINLYYAIVEAEQVLKVREEDVKQQQKNLETIEERNRLGSVTKADVYQQQVQLGNAELQLIQQKNLLETAKSNLLFYLGLDVLENYQYSDSFSEREIKILDTDINTDYDKLSELVKQALINRRDYLAQKLTLDSYYDNLTIARSGHLPSLTGRVGYGTDAATPNNLFKDHSFSAGLTLSIPLFSGFSTHNLIQSAEVDAMNYELQVKDSERLIKQEIQKSFLDLEAAKKGLLVTQKNVSAAEENLKIEQEKYNLGAGKLLDVLIANTSYQNAKTNYINSQFNYIKLSEELKYNLGTLDYKSYE
ncbi:MAG: TolC family protein [Ignavibacterium sp.]|jgi:outer membrane protein|nr:TolC family protein [Ignavibacterium sp.]